jgi:FixJ family two-component response regulator
MTAPSNDIAIVDDDTSLLRAMSRLLESYSYHIQAYGTVKQFIDSLRLKTPSCLIVDLHMEGMTGVELQHHLAVTGVDIPVIVLTGDNAPELRARCLKAGAAAFLLKPVQPDQLRMTIAAAVGEAKARPHDNHSHQGLPAQTFPRGSGS